jgi:hypothetical protein
LTVLYYADNVDGVFKNACNKQYFISKLSMSKLQAESECCKYGMKLLAVESFEELTCLADISKG